MSVMTAAILILQSGSSAAPALPLPEAFQGIWDVSAQACEAPISDMRIEIDEEGIAYWESDGRPIEIFSAGEQDILVTFAMSGEGETWRAQKRFVLDRTGERLFAETMPQPGEPFYKTIWFYHRCPVGTPMGWGAP
ncbi:hypothetical protein [Parasphingopyxis marina]|uniref:Uncharacterized protein n=1 Tax=Parasphingopyxis marina TaxID=2761622 RepID=A0A842HTB3_9SPHN|nr:hypothetical protein [Parasphingopyxis marina]MBC2776185.1 hypothetical protein [Parasphingopyxis marina]